MKKMTRCICRFAALLVLASFATAAPALAAELPKAETLRAWIQDMKNSDRGPFARVRWFCSDGTVLPPKAYACRPHGGGVQHGEWTDRVRRLRDGGYFVANILAGLDVDKVLARPDFRDLFNQTLIERFLINADDGWILRKARFYRGALQEEDERDGARRLLTALCAKDDWLGQHFLALRSGARLLPHGSDSSTVVEIRQLSAALSEERDTLEDVIEPYLIQQGFIMRTPRGRVATTKCYHHFGLIPPSEPGAGDSEQGRLRLD